MAPEAELLLFAAARAQLVRQVVIPGLQEGKIILCDRFLDSTTVYQGAARSISSDPVSYINQFRSGQHNTGLNVYFRRSCGSFDRPSQTTRNGSPDRMEQENVDFYKKVREGYLLLARSLPERFHVVDGTRELRENQEDILKTVLRAHLIVAGSLKSHN